MILSDRGGRLVRGASAPRAPVPVAGAELLTNGGFEAGDTGWVVGAGWTISDGTANANATGTSYLYQSLTPHRSVDEYLFLSWSLVSQIAQSVRPSIGGNDGSFASVVGNYVLSGRYINLNAEALFTAINGSQLSIDNASVKLLTLASLISTKRYSSPNCDITANVTRIAGTQAGFAMRVDDPANPANFLFAYETGAGRIKVDKCLSGVYSNVIDAPITYGAGMGLRGVCSGTTVTVYYNGTLVGTAQVTDAAIVGNQNHGLFSTHASNTFANYRNRVGEWVLYQDAPVPVAGPELLANGTFDDATGWTLGDGWTISGGKLVANNANFAAATSSAYQLTDSWIQAQFEQSAGWNGAVWLRFAENDGVGYGLRSPQPAMKIWRITEGFFAFTAAGLLVAAEIDNVSVRKLDAASLLSVRAYASADIDLYAGLNRTAGTQAGFALRVDDPDDPQNFIIVYLTGSGRVKADKVVSGVYTNVLDAAITYGVGVGLRAVANGTSVSVYYNGVQIGSTVTVADASIRYNTHHGLFSTYSGNTFSNYVAIAAL